jgi:hypothetical protein
VSIAAETQARDEIEHDPSNRITIRAIEPLPAWPAQRGGALPGTGKLHCSSPSSSSIWHWIGLARIVWLLRYFGVLGYLVYLVLKTLLLLARLLALLLFSPYADAILVQVCTTQRT